MFNHPEILFDLARQHQSELIADARREHLARSVARARAPRKTRRHGGGRAEAGSEVPRLSAPEASLVTCGAVAAEPVR